MDKGRVDRQMVEAFYREPVQRGPFMRALLVSLVVEWVLPNILVVLQPGDAPDEETPLIVSALVGLGLMTGGMFLMKKNRSLALGLIASLPLTLLLVGVFVVLAWPL